MNTFFCSHLLYLLRHCLGERYIRDTLLTISATMSQFGVWPGDTIIRFRGSSSSTCTAYNTRKSMLFNCKRNGIDM